MLESDPTPRKREKLSLEVVLKSLQLVAGSMDLFCPFSNIPTLDMGSAYEFKLLTGPPSLSFEVK